MKPIKSEIRQSSTHFKKRTLVFIFNRIQTSGFAVFLSVVNGAIITDRDWSWIVANIRKINNCLIKTHPRPKKSDCCVLPFLIPYNELNKISSHTKTGDSDCEMN